MSIQYLNNKLAEHLGLEEQLEIESQLEEAADRREEKKSESTAVVPVKGKDEPAPLFIQNYNGEPIPVTEINDETNKSDRELARASIRNVLTVANDNLGALVALARATEHPRAFEVAATFAKTIVDAATKLEDLIEPRTQKGATNKDGAPAQTIQQQTNIYTTSEDAMKAFREAKAKRLAIENEA